MQISNMQLTVYLEKTYVNSSPQQAVRRAAGRVGKGQHDQPILLQNRNTGLFNRSTAVRGAGRHAMRHRVHNRAPTAEFRRDLSHPDQPE